MGGFWGLGMGREGEGVHVEGVCWLFSLWTAKSSEWGFRARFLAPCLPSWEIVSAIPDAHSGPRWAWAISFIPNLPPL